MVFCVFSCSRRFLTPLHVLNYWSDVVFFFLFFFFLRCLLMDLPDKSHIWRILLRRRRRRGTLGRRWPSERVWYYILFQSYTITNWNHITAPNWGPDNLLKGQFPQRRDPWPPGLPAIFRRMTWLWLQRLCAHTHTHRHTLSSLSSTFFWVFSHFGSFLKYLRTKPQFSWIVKALCQFSVLKDDDRTITARRKRVCNFVFLPVFCVLLKS